MPQESPVPVGKGRNRASLERAAELYTSGSRKDWRTGTMGFDSPSARERNDSTSRWVNRLVQIATPVAALLGAVAALVTALRA